MVWCLGVDTRAQPGTTGTGLFGKSISARTLRVAHHIKDTPLDTGQKTERVAKTEHGRAAYKKTTEERTCVVVVYFKLVTRSCQNQLHSKRKIQSQ